MADRRTNFLVTLVFDENLHIGSQIDTEYSFRNKITKDLQHLIKGKEIKHFVIADDEVINNKLKEELKTGHWIAGTYKDTCSNCRCTYPKNIGFKNYCPYCGAKMESEE